MFRSNRFATASLVLAAAVLNAGTFTVAYPSGTSQLSFLGGLNAGTAYAMVNDNDKLTEAAAQLAFSYGAGEITVTNNSGATLAAGTRLMLCFEQQDGNDVVFMNFPVKFAKIANGDIITDVRPGIFGALEHSWVTMTDPVTTAAKLATLGWEIGAAAVTGGAVALTSANATPLGKVVEGAAITALNTLTPESKLSLVASGTTAFAEGEGYVTLRIRKTYSQSAAG